MKKTDTACVVNVSPQQWRALERINADIRHSVVEACFYNLKLLAQVFEERYENSVFQEKFQENSAELPAIAARLGRYLSYAVSESHTPATLFRRPARLIVAALRQLELLTADWPRRRQDADFRARLARGVPQAIDAIMQSLTAIKDATDARKKDVAAVVRKAVRMQEGLFTEKGIDVDLRLHSCVAFIDEQLLLDACVELLRNVAMHAFAAGGDKRRLCVVSVGYETARRRAVVLEVRDNGCGMERRFLGGGSGQGLALVRAAIEQAHGGSVRIAGRSGRGVAVAARVPVQSEDVIPGMRLAMRSAVLMLGAVVAAVIIIALFRFYIAPETRQRRAVDYTRHMRAARRPSARVPELALTIMADQGRIDMVLVRAGPFLRGTDEGAWYEQPERVLTLADFYIDRYEVTNAAFERCFPEPAVLRSDYSDQDSMPVVNVTWYQAIAYCNWRSGIDGLEACYDLSTGACDYTKNGYRLPTEAEWEKAARGYDGRKFPWGDVEPDATRANMRGVADGFSYVAPVGSFPAGASPYGVMDMAGNIWEWCDDWYDPMVYGNAADEDPRGPPEGATRVVRGGAWNSHANALATWRRYNVPPVNRNFSLGFRCVRNAGI